MARAKHWCFTVNNFTDDDYSKFIHLDSDSTPILPPAFEYVIVGKEVGESGTPHLQGFVAFADRKRLAGCRTICARAHWSVSRSVPASIEYCRKDGDYVEVGHKPPPTSQGKRVDLDALKESIQGGVVDMQVLREEHSMVCAQYPRFVEAYLRDNIPPPTFVLHVLKPWQQQLVDIANGPVDPRKVFFIVDLAGAAGKTYLASYLETQCSKKTQTLKPGKLADMAFEYHEFTELLILDCPRSKQGEYIQYDFLEAVKDGRLFSPKYESRVKRFNPPHVFVFMNEFPDESKLSVDRYEVIHINES